jgi:hypothetical protein
MIFFRALGGLKAQSRATNALFQKLCLLPMAAATLLMISSEAYAGRNYAPTISGSPDTEVDAGSAYDFVPTASDQNGDSLSFSIAKKPSWASFNSSTGRLHGTPGSDDAGTYSDIVISVSDGRKSDSLPGFSIQVLGSSAGNQPPTINGNPPTAVTAGQNYNFNPSASDPDGDDLSFSIDNRPGWASFNSSNGSLTGTPGEGEVGTTAPIVIAVSDGQAGDSLSAFQIQVQSAGSGTGTASLSWTPPTERTDGSPLTNLAGYRIHYGNARNTYDRLINVNNPGIASYVVDNLSDGTWYFAVTAFTTDGLSSDYSNEESKQVGEDTGGPGPGPGKGKKK